MEAILTAAASTANGYVLRKRRERIRGFIPMTLSLLPLRLRLFR